MKIQIKMSKRKYELLYHFMSGLGVVCFWWVSWILNLSQNVFSIFYIEILSPLQKLKCHLLTATTLCLTFWLLMLWGFLKLIDCF